MRQPLGLWDEEWGPWQVCGHPFPVPTGPDDPGLGFHVLPYHSRVEGKPCVVLVCCGALDGEADSTTGFGAMSVLGEIEHSLPSALAFDLPEGSLPGVEACSCWWVEWELFPGFD